MAEAPYDVAVIGGGPGGYAAAIAAAQHGMSTACIERRSALGGTCLNVGCIPSKTLLHWSGRYHEAGHEWAGSGVSAGELTLDLGAMMANKNKVVSQLTDGIAFLFRKNKVAHLTGNARLTGRRTIAVDAGKGETRTVTARNIVIATGSESAPLPGVTTDEERVVTSTGALALPRVPERMAVIGGGYIGLELGSVWRRLGAEVTVIELLDRLSPTMDSEVARQFQRLLARQGLTFRLATRVSAVETTGNGAALTLEPAAGGDTETLAVDVVLVSVGRRPHTNDLGAEEAGIALDDKGFVMVDERYRTNVEGIFAIGDVIRGPMLAHRASSEAHALVDILAGGGGSVNYDAIPSVVYTEPEVAWVGQTEDALKAASTTYRKGRFPFTANSRARTVGHTAGFVKVLSDAETDRVLGVHILGADAGNLIAEATAVMEFGGSAEDIARTCHAHPSLSEAVMEAAALAAFGKAVHL